MWLSSFFSDESLGLIIQLVACDVRPLKGAREARLLCEGILKKPCVCTRFAALGSAALMAIAVYSLQVVKGFGWTWNTGGYEYPVFWGICSLAVALHAWQAWFAARKTAAHPVTRLVAAE